MKNFLISILSLITPFLVSADAVDDAAALIASGDFSAAKSILVSNLPTVNKNSVGRANYLIGKCDLELGDFDSARHYLTVAKEKNVPEANLLLGRLAFLDYDFELASKAFNAYSLAMKKAKKSIAPDLELFESQLSDAESFLDRVEKIVILDSIAVDKDDFFKAYKLPPSEGSLRTGRDFPIEDLREDVDYFFTNEGEDRIMWAQTDSTGYKKINEAVKLTDGSWSVSPLSSDQLSEDADCIFPFMMADGVTLYYASDGEGSIGGFDIFVATRDASTGEFLQPQNIGMPYNSPYDDYLLAIDEMNGVGWWATDRNRLDDKITIYVFIVNELRKNYSPDDEFVVEAARISDFKSTQNPDIDYSDIIATIRDIDPAAKVKKADFYFPVKSGKIFTSLDDFKSPAARTMMKKYLDASKQYESDLQTLSSLRKKYHLAASESLKRQILDLEKKTERQREDIKKIKSEVYRALK